jgi:pimeloyl-ACP methyl ester carboxylesterase
MEEKISITNNRDLKLAAVLHFPSKAIKYPAVIVLHGFTGSKEEEHITSLARDLQRKGFCTIRFDMSGLGESEGSIENDYRLSHYLDDIDAVYKDLCGQYFIDPENISIVGHSMGGKAALLYAARNPNIRAVCAISAPAQLGDAGAFKKDMNEWKKTGWLERSSSQFGFLSFPYAFIKDAMRHDVRKVAPRIKQPKLIVWGTKDATVLPTETEELYDFLDEPKESFIVNGMDHHYKRDPKLMTKVNNRIISFFRENV